MNDEQEVTPMTNESTNLLDHNESSISSSTSSVSVRARIIKAIVSSTISTLFITVIMLIPAYLLGGIHACWTWTRVWIYLGCLWILSMGGMIYMAHQSPKSFAARQKSSISSKQSTQDKRATLMILFGFLLVMIFAPISEFGSTQHDDVVVHWPIWSSIFGLCLNFGCYIMYIIVSIQNEYAQTNLEQQDDDNQRLVDTGFYAYVRHPMYVSAILQLLGFSIYFQSIWSMTIGLSIFIIGMIWRIRLEEEQLLDDDSILKDAYLDYMQRVPYRLIPYIV